MDILYFAWVRERIGIPREQVETSAATVADLVAELRLCEERYELAFSDLTALRVAVDQKLADFDAPLDGVREVERLEGGGTFFCFHRLSGAKRAPAALWAGVSKQHVP